MYSRYCGTAVSAVPIRAGVAGMDGNFGRAPPWKRTKNFSVGHFRQSYLLSKRIHLSFLTVSSQDQYPDSTACHRPPDVAMLCTCRSTSLRIFVQSLTPVKLPAAAAARPRVPRCNATTLLPASRHDGFMKSFASASAACHPRQRPQAPSSSPDGQSQPISDPVEPNNDTYTRKPANAADDAFSPPTVNLDEAKESGSIFELSPDAVETLAATLRQMPPGSTPFDEAAGLESTGDTESRSKPPLGGPSRLKRSKIVPPNATNPRQNPTQPKKEYWQIQREALKAKFPEGWAPRKRLSPDALEGIRALHKQYPQEFTTPVLAQQFAVSPEAIRRILRAKWTPTAEEEQDREERWFKRGKTIWSNLAELGMKPPKKWRREGVVRDARWNQKRGPREHYPYVPRWRDAEAQEDDEKGQEASLRKLGEDLL